MERVLIIGTPQSIDFSGFIGAEILNFLHSGDCHVYALISTYDGLMQKVEENPNSVILYCPTRIPDEIFKKMSQDSFKTRAILSQFNCTIGYIQVKKGKVKKINFSFNWSGYVNKQFNPAKIS